MHEFIFFTFLYSGSTATQDVINNNTQKVTAGIVADIISCCLNLYFNPITGHPMPRSIILVLDGESLPIKSETHDKRDQYATSKFKEAKELYKSRGIKNKDFIAAAKSAVRFTSDIKTAIIEVV